MDTVELDKLDKVIKDLVKLIDEEGDKVDKKEVIKVWGDLMALKYKF
jgi:hypothetical protein